MMFPKKVLYKNKKGIILSLIYVSFIVSCLYLKLYTKKDKFIRKDIMVTICFIYTSYYRIHMDDFVSSVFDSFKSVDFLDVRDMLKIKPDINNPFSDNNLPKSALKIDNYDDFNKYLNEGIKIIFTPMNGKITFSNIKFYRALNKKNIKIIGRQINSAVIPEGYYSSSNNYRDRKNVFHKTLARLNLVLYLVLLKIKCFPKYSLYFISGKKLMSNITKYKLKYEEVIETHSYVYDEYLSNKKNVSEEYIVFLDANIPLHPEYKDRGFENIDADIYYKNLTKAFNLIEKITGKNVVVCAHPLYIMSDSKKHYDNREVYKFETDEYIAKAYCVIVNATSAINKAVMYNKPIIQLTSNDFNDFIKNEIILYKQLLDLDGFDFYNLDENEVIKVFNKLTVNENMYDKYIIDFLASDTSQETSTEKIIQAIQNKYIKD